MRNCRENAPSASVVLSKVCSRLCLTLLAVLLLLFWTATSSMAQSGSTPPAQPSASPASQSQTPPQSQSQTPPQNQTQKPAQPAPQSNAATQTNSGDKQPSLADAARANAKIDKPKSKRVITDDDLSSIHGKISVVGDHSPRRGSDEDADSDEDSQEDRPVSSTKANEQYWRSRAQAIKGQIADVEQQISNKKDEIAKAGPAGFDASSGLSQNVIVVHDRNAELKKLEDRKQSLERQLDDLADEGRKAGADSGWFR